MTSGRNPLRRVPTREWAEQEPTWWEAHPALIDAALARARFRPSGNWYVLGAREAVRGDRPFGRTVAGVEVVAWRGRDGVMHAGPGACPHLGAPLCRAALDGDGLVCRWHGLRVGPDGAPGWRPFPARDDGVLAWVRLDGTGGGAPTDGPVLPRRPPLASAIAAVVDMTGRCEPEDVLANRLDPWHGAWFHPYSFTDLRVLSAPSQEAAEAGDRFLVEVTFRVGSRLGVPVHAEFSCPEPRTVTMEIVDGEGAGSVVETHATPLGPGPDGAPRTAVVEATLAYSDRRGFSRARAAAPVLRPLLRWAARRLWRDDLAYAERRYALRSR